MSKLGDQCRPVRAKLTGILSLVRVPARQRAHDPLVAHDGRVGSPEEVEVEELNGSAALGGRLTRAEATHLPCWDAVRPLLGLEPPVDVAMAIVRVANDADDEVGDLAVDVVRVLWDRVSAVRR